MTLPEIERVSRADFPAFVSQMNFLERPHLRKPMKPVRGPVAERSLLIFLAPIGGGVGGEGEGGSSLEGEI